MADKLEYIKNTTLNTKGLKRGTKTVKMNDIDLPFYLFFTTCSKSIIKTERHFSKYVQR